ncbi:hypothetical protein EGR_11274 [Echinococcus granulosus]|uniref:Uncharacterized protein n=1 Tax=Echinococcus granulosus TaxID=6210 RepID=W6UK38_ECHGR|nr:hypothetical protein EGR_11274 [Echinococcus granulosus]EUB53874.1 hypothetical protein EGR_11274 [Echinococcus granulosus]
MGALSNHSTRSKGLKDEKDAESIAASSRKGRNIGVKEAIMGSNNPLCATSRHLPEVTRLCRLQCLDSSYHTDGLHHHFTEETMVVVVVVVAEPSTITHSFSGAVRAISTPVAG